MIGCGSGPTGIKTLSAKSPTGLPLLSKWLFLFAAASAIESALVAGAQNNIAWSGSGSDWDTTGTMDWLNGTTPWAYTNGDTVTFNDSAPNDTVQLDTVILPRLVVVSNTVPYTFADGTGVGGGFIAGTATILKEGTGTLTMAVANTYSGPTIIKAGILQIGNVSIGDIGTGNVTNNAALVFDQGDGNTHFVEGSISGTGSVTVAASDYATIVLAANNNYSGPTTINGGTLQVGNGGAMGSLGTYLIVTNNSALVFDGSGSIVLPYDITGSGSLAFDGSGKVSLAGSTLNYQGNTYISNGVVQLEADNELPNANNVAGSSGDLNVDGGVITPGTLDMNGHNVTVNALSGRQNAVNGIITNSSTATTTNVLLTLQTSATTYNGQIMDHGISGAKTELFVTGPETLTLNPANSNLFSGGIVVSNGSLTLGTPGGVGQVNAAENQLAPGSGPITLLGTNTILTMAGAPPGNNVTTYANLLNAITIPAGQSVTVYNSQRGNIAGTLTGNGTVNLVSSFFRGGVDGNWSAFRGQILLSGSNPTESSFIGFGNTNGLPNSEVVVTTNVVMYCGTVDTQFPFYALFPIGALSGGDSSDEIAAQSTGNAGGHPATFEIGSLNLDTTYSGGIVDSNNLLKVGTGTFILNNGGVLQTNNNPFDPFPPPPVFGTYNISFIGTTTVSNGTLALDAPVVLTNCTAVILAGSNAVLDARDMGYITNLANPLPDGATQELVIVSTFEVVTSQILSGYGTLEGNLQADPGSIFKVGLPTGTFQVTSNASLSGIVIMNLDDTNTPANSELVAQSYTIGEVATLIVTNLGPGLYNETTFHLFNQGVPGFASVTLPATDPTGTTNYIWSNNIASNGSITLTHGGLPSGPPPVPPVISFSISKTSLTLSWPPAWLGYVLQVQTNTLETGLGANWVDLPETTSETNLTITINPANGSVFYRLAQP